MVHIHIHIGLASCAQVYGTQGQALLGELPVWEEILMAAEHLMYVLGRDKAVALKEDNESVGLI